MSQQFETKDFTGAIFKNDKRDKDSQPHMKGEAVIDGVAYWVSAWTNTSSKGTRYQSLKFSAKEEAHTQGMAQTREALAQAKVVTVSSGGSFEDDIPFAPRDKGLCA